MLTGMARGFRWSFRLSIAVVFWSHAFLLMNGYQTLIDRLSALVGLSASETVIVLALISVWLMSFFGQLQMWVDLAYVYLFPFILIYYALRWFVKVALAFCRAYIGTQKEGTSAKVELGHKAEDPKPSEEPTLRSFSKRLCNIVLCFRPLWCVLLLVSVHRTITILAFCVVLLQLAKTLTRTVQFSLLVRAKARIETALQEFAFGAIHKLDGFPLDSDVTDEMRNLWRQLKAIQSWTILLNRWRQVCDWISALTALALGSMYLYIALLFSFAYYGLAKVNAIQLGWLEALATAVFIPFSYGRLPHGIGFVVLGGVQASIALMLGIGAILSQVQEKLNSLRRIIEIVDLRFKAQEVQSRFDALSRKILPESTPKPNL